VPLFAYTALAENGATLSGEGVAVSEEALRSELSGRGLLVQRVRPKHTAAGFGLSGRCAAR
jgi:type II secretory pathway component PulF